MCFKLLAAYVTSYAIPITGLREFAVILVIATTQVGRDYCSGQPIASSMAASRYNRAGSVQWIDRVPMLTSTYELVVAQSNTALPAVPTGSI